jgi:trehalose 6-phosphate phosphatase
MISCSEQAILDKVANAERLWLFLDYDGTLADFAQTPDDILPDGALVALIEALHSQPDIRLTIISGRRLGHIQTLIPVPGILKAGTYGIELCTPEEETIHRVDREQIRPLLDALKETWGALLDGKEGFYLEDKGMTLAIHAKDAAEEDALPVLEQAREAVEAMLQDAPEGLFRVQGGHRFLECGPQAADKKRTVEHILSTYPWHEQALLLYLGDDDKDEVAFEAIRARDGVVIAVGERLKESAASCWLPSPQSVRHWLRTVIKARSEVRSR